MFRNINNRKYVETINRDAYSFNKEGIVQDLLRISYLSTISHLRRIQTPLDSNIKLLEPRKLNTTSWLHMSLDTLMVLIASRNLAIGCSISQSDYNIYSKFIKLFSNLTYFVSYISDTFIKSTLYVINTKIFVDGVLIGIYVNNDILDIVDYLRLAKRNNILNNNEFSISFNYEYKELYILTDFGRCIRPLYIVNYNDSDKKYNILRNKYDENSDWDVLTKGTLNEDDRKKLLNVFMNNLNNITKESIEILEKIKVL